MCLPWNYPSLDQFNEFQAGYRYNAITFKSLTEKNGGFDENWFVICSNYFDDPFFIDISEIEKDFPVYYRQHGGGTLVDVAKSITDFSDQLKQIKKLENNKELLLDELKNKFDLQNEFWIEVYESTFEDEE
jgi:hypothetical protein